MRTGGNPLTIARMTPSTAAVLQALAVGCRYGFDIAESTGLRGGTVYPLLRRLESGGLLRSRWEEASIARAEGRPSRKYYELLPAADAALWIARERFPVELRRRAGLAAGPTSGEGRA